MNKETTLGAVNVLYIEDSSSLRSIKNSNELEEICLRYYSGVRQSESYIDSWQSVKPYVDQEIYTPIENKLKRQAWEAEWWKDACLLYFKTYSNQRIPAQYPPIKRSLQEVKILVEIYQMR